MARTRLRISKLPPTPFGRMILDALYLHTNDTGYSSYEPESINQSPTTTWVTKTIPAFSRTYVNKKYEGSGLQGTRKYFPERTVTVPQTGSVVVPHPIATKGQLAAALGVPRAHIDTLCYSQVVSIYIPHVFQIARLLGLSALDLFCVLYDRDLDTLSRLQEIVTQFLLLDEVQRDTLQSFAFLLLEKNGSYPLGPKHRKQIDDLRLQPAMFVKNQEVPTRKELTPIGKLLITAIERNTIQKKAIYKNVMQREHLERIFYTPATKIFPRYLLQFSTVLGIPSIELMTRVYPQHTLVDSYDMSIVFLIDLFLRLPSKQQQELMVIATTLSEVGVPA